MFSEPYHTKLFTDSLTGATGFIQQQIRFAPPSPANTHQEHLVFFVLYSLLFLLAISRYFYPDALRSLFQGFAGHQLQRNKEEGNKLGWFISSFLTLNTLVGLTLLMLVLLTKYRQISPKDFSRPELWGTLLAGIGLYYLFNQFLHWIAGFLFDTGKQAGIQIKNTAFWFYLTGIFLTPLLLVYFYSGSFSIIYIIILLLGFLLIYKWILTYYTGLSLPSFHVLHIFLYLCAVEIIPLLILVKTGLE